MRLKYEDDASIHPTGTATEWRESYYCNFFDTESRYFGTAWQGVRPNQERAETVFLLFDGDRPLIHDVQTNVHIEPDIGVGRLELSSQRFECVEPWRHWTVQYSNGDSRVDVDWQQISEFCDWDSVEDEQEGTEFLAGAKHYEAAGRVTVKAEVGGRRIEFTGFGERDRAWGQRNYGHLAFGWWQTVQFPDGQAAHIWAMQNPGTDIDLYGFLHVDGITKPVARFDCEVSYEDGEGPPSWSRQRIVDSEGREMLITGMELMQVLNFATQSDGANIEVGQATAADEKPYYWTWQRYIRDDGVVGHGMIDLALWQDHRHTSFTTDKAAGTMYDYGLVPVDKST